MNIQIAVPCSGPSTSTDNHASICYSVFEVISATVPSVYKSAIQGIAMVHLVVRINWGFCSE